MSKAPAFQFYPKDWFSDSKVKAMSLEAKGAYIELLGLYWLEEGLPADTDKLARSIGVAPAKFRRLWPQIEPCFRVEGNRIHQKRMDEEREKQDTHRAERAESGRKGAERKWKEKMAQPSKGNGSAIDQPMAKDGFSFAVSVLPSATANEQRTTDPGADAPPFDPPETPLPPTTAALTVSVEAEPLPWNREAAELWFQEYQGDAPKQFFGALKPLVRKYTWERVRPALVAYMAETPCEYVNVAGKFGAAFGTWEARARGQPAKGKAKETVADRSRRMLGLPPIGGRDDFGADVPLGAAQPERGLQSGAESGRGELVPQGAGGASGGRFPGRRE